MTQFSENIRTDDETLNLSFNRIYTAEGENFYVVVEKNRQFFPFDMKKDVTGKWKITDPVPAWAKTLEEQLSEIIKRNAL
jgi:hypothetical protein